MLEIVITGRHDNYGGEDFQDRLCAAAEHNHRLLTDFGIPHRFTLAEWNPVPGRRLFADIVRSRLPWWHNCLIIDPVWHERSSTNPRLQFMEFFGKNAAVRRSPADAILTTNSDVFLSTELVRTLKGRELDDRTIYRAVRIDVDRNVDWRASGGRVEAVISDPAGRLRVNDVQPPDYGNSAGDFLLLTRRAWFAIGGFNERVRYAKIHKDGQFCVNGWLEGYAFDVLGPIYHVDHDGSYANAGAMLGSPDAPYGPEWDYRKRYRNARSWGLSAGIDCAREPGVIEVRHPSTHGALLSVIELRDENDAAGANAALADARSQFVAIARPGGLAAFGDRAGLEAMLAAAQDGILVPAGSIVQHPTLGPIPRHDTPVIYRRDVIDALTDWDEADPDAALGFWLCATEVANVAEVGPARAGHAGHLAPERRVTATVEAKILSRRGALLPAGVLTAAVAEQRAAARDLPLFARQWLQAIAPEPAAPCAVIGPDWATPLLIEAIHDTGRTFAGLFTAQQAEEDSCRSGERLRPLAELRSVPANTYVLAGSADRLAERIAGLGCHVSLHALSDAAEEPAATADAELDAIRRAQARDLAARRIEAALARLPLLALLEGERALQHMYDAAMLCDQTGRQRDAESLFRQVITGALGDEPLRMRSSFHLARLCADRGNTAEAQQLLAAVIAHNPDHRAARQLLEAAAA